MNWKTLVGTLAVAAVAAGAGYLMQRWTVIGMGEGLMVDGVPASAAPAADAPGPAALAQLPEDLRLNDLAGQPHGFGEWKGKWLLLNFWASWCGPCLDEMPQLLAAQKKYGASGLQIVGPAVDDPEAAQQIQSKLHIDYPVLVGQPDQLLGLMAELGNDRGGLPFSVLVDPDGRIVERQLGQFEGHELEQLLERHLRH